MNDSEKDFQRKVIKTWNWKVNKTDYHVPDGIDPRFFYCRNHKRENEDLLPYCFKGQKLYVCRFCGTVYEVVSGPVKKRVDLLITWPVLFQQPYDWHYIRNPARLMYSFVHECGIITEHPILDAHCRGNRADSLELIARFFSSKALGDGESIRFFHEDIKTIKVSQDDDTLILSSGKFPGKFPKDEFCVYREQPNSLSLEFSHSWDDNIFGFTADVNSDDYEHYEGYLLIKFTFLGDDDSDLPDRIRELDKHPAGKEQILDDDKGLTIKRQIVRDPFELNGFFLYEIKDLTR